jgi:diguanylate cyclase (GGDEF)-like protein
MGHWYAAAALCHMLERATMTPDFSTLQAENNTLRQRNMMLEQMVHQQHQRIVSLETERDMLLTILNRLPASVSLHESNHTIRFANQAFRERYGEPDLRPCYEILSGGDAPCGQCPLHASAAGDNEGGSHCCTPADSGYQIHNQVFSSQDGKPLNLAWGIKTNAQPQDEDKLSKTDLERQIEERTAMLRHAVSNLLQELARREQAEESLNQANMRLVESVGALEQQNREITLLNEMGDFLQGCQTLHEAYRVVSHFASLIFPNLSGALYILSASHHLLEAEETWGEHLPAELVVTPDDCWALRRVRPHITDSSQSKTFCNHLRHTNLHGAACIPLLAQSQTLGVLHLRQSASQQQDVPLVQERLALMFADQVSLALANLHLREQLRHQSIRDPLTGLFNRRYLEVTLEREVRQATRHHRSVGIMMIDIDHFKRFNDSYSHAAGDMVIRVISAFLLSHTRGEDIACRYGGEEFTLILPEASLSDTVRRAEHLRCGVEQLVVEHHGQRLPGISISIGVAAFPNHGDRADTLINIADAALLRAKHTGRNRVVMAEVYEEEQRELGETS